MRKEEYEEIVRLLREIKEELRNVRRNTYVMPSSRNPVYCGEPENPRDG